MFDRSNRAAPLCVEITLTDGRKLEGKFLVPQGRALAEILNGPASFIEFQVATGERTFIAKSSIQTATPLEVARASDVLQRDANSPSVEVLASTAQ